MSLTSDILSRCESLGFALAGVASIEPSERTRELREWLAAGKHGEMEYLARNADIRENPAHLLEGARCAIMVADQYARREVGRSGGGEIGRAGDREGEPDCGPRPRGRIARYAQGDDYHVVIKKRLHSLCDELRAAHPQDTFRAFVDTAPVQERELAMRAGLGWIAKHTLLIHPRVGSWLLLGGIMTTLDLDTHPRALREPDHCGSCTRCIDACPTSCITPYSIDASRCISYLTIEHRSIIPEPLLGAIGDWLFGCDVCQEVCPHNSPRPAPAGEAHDAYTPRRDSFDLLEVLAWNENDRAREFRKSALGRASLDMMKRNARAVIGRSDAGKSGELQP